MSLTGHAFQWLTIAIALACTMGIVLLWNKIRGPRGARTAGRVGMLILGYLTSAVAVLVSINIAYGGLIASWGDLFDNLRPAHGNFGQHHDHHQPPALPIAEPSTLPTLTPIPSSIPSATPNP